MNSIFRLRLSAFVVRRLFRYPATQRSVIRYFSSQPPRKRQKLQPPFDIVYSEPGPHGKGSIPIRLIDLILSGLENNRVIGKFADLVRMPYYCSLTGQHGNGDRFVKVVDRWWDRIQADIREGQRLEKPSSMVYHLGRLNHAYHGAVVQNLGIDKVRQLIKYAIDFDFLSLPNRYDVTSLLAGIRNFVSDTRKKRVVNPSLTLVDPAFYQNLERYVRQKAKERKEAHDLYPNDNDNWMFMIEKEATHIMIFLRCQELNVSILRQIGDDLLIELCRLAKTGFEHCATHALPKNVYDFCLLPYAEMWLFWQFDPDTLVPDSWRSWYRVYQRCFMKREFPIAENAEFTTRYLSYMGLLPQVAVRLKKMEHFLPLFDSWLSDVEKALHSFAGAGLDRSFKGIECVKALTDIIYDCGLLAQEFADNDRSAAIKRLESVMPPIAFTVLEAIEPDLMNDVSMGRYLTGLRDFRVSTKPKFQFSTDFAQKLNSYLDSYTRIVLRNLDPNDAVHEMNQASMVALMLRHMEIPMDVRLWTSLIAVFERSLLGRSRQAFEKSPDKLWISLVYFGDAAFYYRLQNEELNVDKKIWREYFAAAKLLLESTEIQKTSKNARRKQGVAAWSDSQSSSPSGSALKRTDIEYRYFIGVLISVARLFECVDEFLPIKDVLEKGCYAILDSYNSRSAFLMARKMKGYMMNTDQVRFDPKLLSALREIGTAYAKSLDRRDS